MKDFPLKKPLANGCYGAYKKKQLKFVDKLNNVFVKITIYSPIDKLDISPKHCNKVYNYMVLWKKILTAIYLNALYLNNIKVLSRRKNVP
jgi:hypothetical protein